MKNREFVIRAAGAVLWRSNEPEQIEIALVHRPRYDDWTLPKGKVEGDEPEITTAYREVLEETGVKAIFGPELGEVEYDVEGVQKNVRFWSARAHEYTTRLDNNEVDEIRWLSPSQARPLLTYELDRRVLNTFLALGTGTSALILMRHCKSLKRSEWHGDDDDDRPLDTKGARQANGLKEILQVFGDLELHSSDATRCQQSLEPFVREKGRSIITETSASEYAYKRDKKPLRELVLTLAAEEKNVLLCTHRPMLPDLILTVLQDSFIKPPTQNLEPGSAWVIHSRAGIVIKVDLLDPPKTPKSVETEEL